MVSKRRHGRMSLHTIPLVHSVPGRRLYRDNAAGMTNCIVQSAVGYEYLYVYYGYNDRGRVPDNENSCARSWTTAVGTCVQGRYFSLGH